jgi:uncharacterized membrane protein
MSHGQHPGHGPYGPPPQGYDPHGHGPQGYGPQGYGPQGYGPPRRAPRAYGPPPQGHPPPQVPQWQQAPPPHQPPRQVYDPPPSKRRRAEVPTGGPVTDEDERWAVPAYVGLFVGGFVAPAIVLAVKGRSSPFARFHAVQALNLFITVFVCNVLAFVLVYEIGTSGLPVTLALLAGESYCVIKAAIGANRCEWYRLPAILAWPIVR